MIRPYAPGDLDGVLELWQEGGRWYRDSLPVSERMVRDAWAQLAPRRGLLGLRAPRGIAGWVVPGPGSLEAALYARIDADLSYVVPSFRRSQGDGHGAGMDALLDEAEAWFRPRWVRSYRLDAPGASPERSARIRARGTVLWHRCIYRRAATPLPEVGPSVVPFSPRFGRSVAAFVARRLPGGRIPPAPIPFLNVVERSWNPVAARPTGTRAWVLWDGQEARGIAGATRFSDIATGEVGPWLLDDGVPEPEADGLLAAPVRWLAEQGTAAVRASVPSHLGREERALHRTGFRLIGESDVVEVPVS